MQTQARLALAALSSFAAALPALADARSEKLGITVEVQQLDTESGPACDYTVHNRSSIRIGWFGVGDPTGRFPDNIIHYSVEPRPLPIQRVQPAPEGWTVQAVRAPPILVIWSSNTADTTIAPSTSRTFRLALDDGQVQCDQIPWLAQQGISWRPEPPQQLLREEDEPASPPDPPLPLPELSEAVLTCCARKPGEEKIGLADAELPELGELITAFRLGNVEIAPALYIHQNLVAQALIRLGDQSAMPDLKDLLKSDSSETRDDAAWVLAKLGDDEGIYLVMADASTRSQEQRKRDREAVKARNWAARHGTLWNVFEQVLDTERMNAVELLGLIGDRRAVPLLCGLLQDVDLDREAAFALGRIGDPQALCAKQ